MWETTTLWETITPHSQCQHALKALPLQAHLRNGVQSSQRDNTACSFNYDSCDLFGLCVFEMVM